MPEDKKDEAAKPAPATADQTSSGPATTAEQLIADKNATETYYLRSGAKHTHIFKGERVSLDQAGQTADLTTTQYEAFSDKFMTKDEYEESQGEVATGASAPGIPDPATMEQTTIEGHNNAANEGVTGKTGTNASGETGKPPAAPAAKK